MLHLELNNEERHQFEALEPRLDEEIERAGYCERIFCRGVGEGKERTVEFGFADPSKVIVAIPSNEFATGAPDVVFKRLIAKI